MYDYAVDKLSANWIECASLHRQPHRFDHPAILTPNIVYYFAMDIRKPTVYKVASSTTTLLQDKLDSRVVAGRESLQGVLAPCFQSLGDQEVFGLVGEDGVELWFFNPKFIRLPEWRACCDWGSR